MFNYIQKLFKNSHVSLAIIGSLILCTIYYLVIRSRGIRNVHSFHHSTERTRLTRAALWRGERNENTSKADALSRKVRILCMVLTYQKNHRKKALHVKNTWGRRCNVLLFMSTAQDDLLPTVKLNVSEGRSYLWGKTKESFRYVYEHYRYDADWFLKADDDTYVMMENLRYFLSHQNPQSHAYFGDINNGYMNGGAGYVLSRSTLNLLVNKGLRRTTVCKKSNVGHEDLVLGTCLKRYHVDVVPSYEPRTGTDPFNRKLFFQNPPLVGYEQIYNDTNLTFKCCSKLSISFHHITPNKMYELEYLIYKLRPYGVSYRD